MAFSRDDLAAYEKQPQTQVADEAAAKPNATPAATPPASDTVETPSDDGTVTSDDQPVADADGTSDDNADPSTANADPSGETETTDEGAGKTDDEAPVAKTPPKKGSAAERVQEVLDLAEGYKEFGKHMQDQLKEALAENARLKGGGTPAPKTDTQPAAPEKTEADEPMPDLTDADINFDTDKLRVKTQKWVDARIEKGTEKAIGKLNGSAEAEKVKTALEARVTAFAATHPDWETVVSKNSILIANQLHPLAARVVAKSEDVAEILYHFGKNTDLAIKTAKLLPEEQLVRLGEIIAGIKASKAASVTDPSKKPTTPAAGAKPSKQKSLTEAPPPPTPTRAAGRPTERDPTDPNMSMDDFAKRHREGKQAARAAKAARR